MKKIGVIIIFHNNEKELDTKLFIEQVAQTSNLELCLVDNESKDNTLLLLEEIKDSCNNVSLVNIKKFKLNDAAVRAGARFMFNHNNFKHLGYINTNALNFTTYDLNDIIKLLCSKKECIVDYNLKILAAQHTKFSLFKSVFSVIEYLKQLKISTQPYLNFKTVI